MWVVVVRLGLGLGADRHSTQHTGAHSTPTHVQTRPPPHTHRAGSREVPYKKNPKACCSFSLPEEERRGEKGERE